MKATIRITGIEITINDEPAEPNVMEILASLRDVFASTAQVKEDPDTATDAPLDPTAHEQAK